MKENVSIYVKWDYNIDISQCEERTSSQSKDYSQREDSSRHEDYLQCEDSS
jgi:hypothetical protein